MPSSVHIWQNAASHLALLPPPPSNRSRPSDLPFFPSSHSVFTTLSTAAKWSSQAATTSGVSSGTRAPLGCDTRGIGLMVETSRRMVRTVQSILWLMRLVDVVMLQTVVSRLIGYEGNLCLTKDTFKCKWQWSWSFMIMLNKWRIIQNKRTGKTKTKLGEVLTYR